MRERTSREKKEMRSEIPRESKRGTLRVQKQEQVDDALESPHEQGAMEKLLLRKGLPLVVAMCSTAEVSDFDRLASALVTVFGHHQLSLTLIKSLITAEVHQTSGTSSDVSFDLMLWATGGGATGPRLTITRLSDTQVRISWGADATGLNLQSNTDLGNPAGWTTVQAIAGAGETTITTTGTMRYFRLRSP